MGEIPWHFSSPISEKNPNKFYSRIEGVMTVKHWDLPAEELFKDPFLTIDMILFKTRQLDQ